MTATGDPGFYGSFYAQVGLLIRDPGGEIRQWIERELTAGRPLSVMAAGRTRTRTKIGGPLMMDRDLGRMNVVAGFAVCARCGGPPVPWTGGDMAASKYSLALVTASSVVSSVSGSDVYAAVVHWSCLTAAEQESEGDALRHLLAAQVVSAREETDRD